MPETSNDNSEAGRPAVVAVVDGQAEAALLLVESLLHGLIERSVISVGDAMDITETAAAAKTEIAADRGDGPARIRGTLTILGSINTSLRSDLLR